MLSLCNIYLGLKIGWGMNMGITSALLAFGLWRVWGTVRPGGRSFGILENNVNQCAGSAAAAISSAGLVAPIPALTLLTGLVLPYPQLVVWILSVGLVGVVAAVLIRRQLLGSGIAFPSGVATGHTLREMYAQGDEAIARVRMLLLGGGAGALSKLVNVFLHPPHLRLPGVFGVGGKVATGYSLTNLTFSLEPSLLMVATGGIIGLRAALSMLVGSLFAWGWLTPYALEAGWMEVGAPDPSKAWFSSSVKWLLWPGVAMMVTSSLTSFAFSGRTLFSGWGGSGGGGVDPTDVPRPKLLMAVAAVVLVSTVLQVSLFDVKPWLAALGVLASFVLAIVAGRVSGETGVTPVGAMGKVTQLGFGLLDPANAASNLMAANVTGGAASQCGELLHDMKTGQMLGSWPRHLAVAQSAGVVGGAVVGSAAYLILIPDPKSQLLTEEWAAPAVATWKAVAEVFMKGIDAMPAMALEALWIGAVVGVVLALAENLAPKRIAGWIPSPVSMGLAFTVQAYTILAFVVGAGLMKLGERFAPRWTERFGIVVCAGVIAGESLAGVGDALWKLFGG
jgi:uncharacterized oligopeptide transporter (OPT) family protein